MPDTSDEEFEKPILGGGFKMVPGERPINNKADEAPSPQKQ
jgi:hypothetical protein